MNKPLSIGIAGLGVVGAGTVKLLAKHHDLLAARCARSIDVVAVSARDRSKDRGVGLEGMTWYDDPLALAEDATVDVVVELVGGSDGVAKALCERALAAGKHVVTANKALMAVHGATLARLAEAHGVTIAYEAAVAGGIPAIKALKEGLIGNGVDRVAGILNGTCNYILTTMRETGRDFEEVLVDAQRLGYAEADPSFDVDGVDAAHKLAILASLAFGCPVDFDAIKVEGIRKISALDIQYAEELGYRIKLLAVARHTPWGIEQRVSPCMVSRQAPIAKVEGVFNAVEIEGDFVGPVMLEGRGAGEMPTASAVVADIADIAAGRITPVFGVPAARLEPLPAAPLSKHRGEYYLRLMVYDRPGVMTEVTAVLAKRGISLASMLQHGRAADEGGVVPVVFTTHETDEDSMTGALAEIAGMPVCIEPPAMIRIEAVGSES